MLLVVAGISKVTSGLVLGICLLAFLLWREKRGRQFCISATVLLAGAGLAAALYFLTIEPFNESISGFLEASQIFQGTGIYGFELIWNKYVLSLTRTACHLFLTISIILALGAVTAFVLRRLAAAYSISVPRAVICCLCISTAIVFYFAHFMQTSNDYVEAFYALPLMLAILTTLATNI